jgi:hypothetical protein
MTGVQVAVLVGQGLVFAAWAAVMFSYLFGLLRDPDVPGHGTWRGPRGTLRAFGHFLTAQAWAARRRALGVLTVLLLALNGLWLWVQMPPG